MRTSVMRGYAVDDTKFLTFTTADGKVRKVICSACMIINGALRYRTHGAWWFVAQDIKTFRCDPLFPRQLANN